MHTRPSLNCPSAAILLALGTLSATAAEFEVGDGKLTVSGSISAGAAYRTVRQDTTLLPNVNSSLVGLPGNAITPTAGRNQDDGNLNFNKGDAVSQVVNGYVSAGYKRGDYGAQASAKAWYDYALEQGEHPWGNIPNGYAPNAKLSDAGAEMRSRFSGVALDNLYAYGRNQLGDMPLDWSLGWQKLEWGNRLLLLGGLRDLNPIDAPAVTRPGMLQREQETRIPVPQIFARVGLTRSTSVEGFYQFHFENNAGTECGTFYSAADYIAPGCDAVTFGNLSDRASLASGIFLHRADTVRASNSGQGGLALMHDLEDWGTKLGLYATQFHSRSPNSSTIKTGRTTGAPFVPGDPDNLNPKYFTEYLEDIRMFGATFETKIPGGLVFGELTYRLNQPLQHNASDILNALLSPVAPTPLRAKYDAVAPGGVFAGYERHKNVQLQFGAIGALPAVLGAAGLNWGAEIVYKGVPDLPDPSVVRFGRSDVLGTGPIGDLCPPPEAAVQCTTEGYVSKHAWGYRLRAGLRYANVTQGMDLLPAILYGHDVKGWSGDGGINEGRQLAILSLRANFKSGFIAEVSWLPTWGGVYNNQRDRSSVQFFVGKRF